MKEPYGEGVAIHSGPESCVVVRKGHGEALTGVRLGWVLSRENARNDRGADAVVGSGRLHPARRYRETCGSFARSETPSMDGNTLHGNREIPFCLRPREPQSASGSLRTHADDERRREVGQLY